MEPLSSQTQEVSGKPVAEVGALLERSPIHKGITDLDAEPERPDARVLLAELLVDLVLNPPADEIVPTQQGATFPLLVAQR